MGVGMRSILRCLLVLSCVGVVLAGLSGRKLLSTNKGCYSVTDPKKCCNSVDARFSIDGSTFGGERCFPSAGKKFSSGNKCEPEVWISEKASRRADAGVCGDEGFVGLALHKVDLLVAMVHSVAFVPYDNDTKLVMLIMALMSPLVAFAEVVALVTEGVLKPGSSSDEAVGKAIMGVSVAVVGGMLLGAFGLF